MCLQLSVDRDLRARHRRHPMGQHSTHFRPAVLPMQDLLGIAGVEEAASRELLTTMSADPRD